MNGGEGWGDLEGGGFEVAGDGDNGVLESFGGGAGWGGMFGGARCGLCTR